LRRRLAGANEFCVAAERLERHSGCAHVRDEREPGKIGGTVAAVAAGRAFDLRREPDRSW